MRALMGLRYTLSTAGVLLGLAFALVVGYDSPLVVGAIGAGIAVFLQAVQQLLVTPLQCELRFGWLSLMSLGGQLLQVIAIVIGVLVGAGVVAFLWIGVPMTLALLLWAIMLVGRKMPLTPSLRWAEVWPLLRDTLPYTVAVALNVVYFRVTILVMSIEASELQTGYFATSFRVVEVLLSIPALVIGAAYPILARAERDDDDRFVYAMRRILELSLILGTWMAMCAVVGAQVAIDVLAGSEGQPAVDVLRIQGITLVSTGHRGGLRVRAADAAPLPRDDAHERRRADRLGGADAGARRSARRAGGGDRHGRRRDGARHRRAGDSPAAAPGTGRRRRGRARDHRAGRRRGGAGMADRRARRSSAW